MDTYIRSVITPVNFVQIYRKPMIIAVNLFSTRTDRSRPNFAGWISKTLVTLEQYQQIFTARLIYLYGNYHFENIFMLGGRQISQSAYNIISTLGISS